MCNRNSGGNEGSGGSENGVNNGGSKDSTACGGYENM